MKISKIFAAAALLAITATSQAGLVTAVGGIDNATIPDNNDFFTPIGPNLSETYNLGGDIFASEALSLTFTNLEFEAGNINTFTFGDVSIVNSDYRTTATGTTDAGLIDFTFSSTRNGNNIGSVTNGSNSSDVTVQEQTFATLFDVNWIFEDGAVQFFDFVLFFDDSGSDVDDNHDDQIIGVNYESLVTAEVSAPGAIALLGFGVIGMSLVRRRKA